jgi:hypothetical protein
VETTEEMGKVGVFRFFFPHLAVLLLQQTIRRAQVFFAVLIKAVTAPGPQLRIGDEASLHRVHVHVVQFLGSLLAAPDVEVVEASLPETAVRDGRAFVPKMELLSGSSCANSAPQPARDALLQYLYDDGRISFGRFAQQQMDVLGHDDVTNHCELVVSSDFREDDQEDVSRACRFQEWQSSVTAEGDEMKVPGSVAALEVFRHGSRTNQTRPS